MSQHISDSTDQKFQTDVLNASASALVLVDFWAPWCGPCKQLTPLLEKVVNSYNGSVKLVKIDIDQNPLVAGQLSIQSIPAVFAFYRGQPVDGFMGALPESQLRQFVDRLTEQLAIAAPAAAGLEQAVAAMEAEDYPAASQILNAMIEQDPEDAEPVGLLLKCLMLAGKMDELRTYLDTLSDKLRNSPEIRRISAQLELADTDPTALDSRIASARLQFMKDNPEAAFDVLLTAIGSEPTWDEGKAYLLKLFDAQGVADPLVMRARRRLASLVFS